MRLIQIIDPRGMQPIDWCDRMALELDYFGTIPITTPGMSWKEWGRGAIQLTEIARFLPPNPDDYEDDEFEDWALGFNGSIT